MHTRCHAGGASGIGTVRLSDARATATPSDHDAMMDSVAESAGPAGRFKADEEVQRAICITTVTRKRDGNIWNRDQLYLPSSYRYVLSTNRYVPCYSMVPL
jgi:hypothetical protein